MRGPAPLSPGCLSWAVNYSAKLQCYYLKTATILIEGRCVGTVPGLPWSYLFFWTVLQKWFASHRAGTLKGDLLGPRMCSRELSMLDSSLDLELQAKHRVTKMCRKHLAELLCAVLLKCDVSKVRGMECSFDLSYCQLRMDLLGCNFMGLHSFRALIYSMSDFGWDLCQ